MKEDFRGHRDDRVDVLANIKPHPQIPLQELEQLS